MHLESAVRVLSELAAGDRLFVLREPIVVTVERDNDGFCVYACDELKLLSYGPTEECSGEEFAKDFAYTWDGLTNEPDSALTEDARQLKARLKATVDHIEKI